MATTRMERTAYAADVRLGDTIMTQERSSAVHVGVVTALTKTRVTIAVTDRIGRGEERVCKLSEVVDVLKRLR